MAVVFLDDLMPLWAQAPLPDDMVLDNLVQNLVRLHSTMEAQGRALALLRAEVADLKAVVAPILVPKPHKQQST